MGNASEKEASGFERTEQELVRIEKLNKLKKSSYPFPNDVKITGNAKAVLDEEVTDPEKAKRFCLAGRIVQARQMGKAAFIHILDSGGKIQVYLKQDAVGAESYEAFKDFDIGDLVEVKGYAFVTKTGEKSLHAESIRLLVKSLIPLPEKWHGLTDVEARYRQRYVDLISNPEVRQVFRKRSQIINEIRRFLDSRGYTEVETPVLNHIAGGATARPFKTHYNALSADMHLRIALELPLKKLIVGGLERVYEIGRIFRNEGLSKKHNPEFTMLEFYQAYATFEDLMTLTEELFEQLLNNVNGSQKVKFGEKEIDFSRPWKRLSMLDSIHEIGGIDKSNDLNKLEVLQSIAKENKIELADKEDWGRCLEALWGDLVEPKIINPVFITHHPFSISPLARQNMQDPKVTDRFELIIHGMETANAFSELNDPQDQRNRFEEQIRRKKKDDHETPDVDEDFLRALEYGMPPTAGEGIGIDRLVMLLTDSATIRDVLLFPQLKFKEE
jgi:lysyl-tRNA synthetase class 2